MKSSSTSSASASMFWSLRKGVELVRSVVDLMDLMRRLSEQKISQSASLDATWEMG